jgi:predicted nucleic acid-binding protein
LASAPVPPTPPPKAYIDTMVFIYHFKKHGLTFKANKFFKDIEKGKYAGVTTTFTISECIGVMRKVLTEARDRPPSLTDVSKLRKEIEKFISEMGIIYFDADTLMSPIYGKLFSSTENVVENAKPFKNPRTNKWFLVGGADALHVTLAVRTGAELYATFDDDFRGVGNWIKPLMLFEVY